LESGSLEDDTASLARLRNQVIMVLHYHLVYST